MKVCYLELVQELLISQTLGGLIQVRHLLQCDQS